MIVSDEFHEGFLAEKIIDNDGVTILTLEQKEDVYQKIINKPFLRLGKVVNVSGLGGGSTLGVANHILARYIDPTRNNGQFGLVAHELGHAIGYNHSSSMTYPKTIDDKSYGFSTLTERLIVALNESNGHPITIANYAYSSDFN